MRIFIAVSAVVLVAGCSAQPVGQPVVSWQYGAGNGDGVKYPGGEPTYSRAYGLGNGDGVQSGQTATTSYGYGADGASGTMVGMSPAESRRQVAAPTPPSAAAGGPGSHL